MDFLFQKNHGISERSSSFVFKRIQFVYVIISWMMAMFVCCGSSDYKSAVFRHIADDQDSSIGNVLSIYQDERGFLWFGSDKGLHKYDGYRYEHYFSGETSNSLSDSYINCLTGVDDFLLIGTRDGLNIYDPVSDRFDRFAGEPGNSDSLYGNGVTDVAVDDEGRIWVGTQLGFSEFDFVKGSFRRIPLQASSIQEQGDLEISDLAVDAEGVVWVATVQGVYRYDPSSATSEHFQWDKSKLASDSEIVIRTLCCSSSGNVFLGSTENGVFVWNRELDRVFQYTSFSKSENHLIGNSPNSIIEDQNQHIWIATNEGISVVSEDDLFTAKQDVFVNLKKTHARVGGLATNDIEAAYLDRSGRIWLGGRFGPVCVYDPLLNYFKNIKFTDLGDEFLSNNLTAIVEDSEGLIWMGCDGGGLYRWNRRTGEVDVIRHDSNNEQTIRSNKVLALTFDFEGQLWIGTWSGGLSRMNPKNGQIKHYLHDPKDDHSIASNQVFYLFEDTSKNLWVGLWNGALNLYDREQDHFVRFPYLQGDEMSCSDDIVSFINQDSTGKLWLGLETADLNSFDPLTGRFKSFDSDDDKKNIIDTDNVSSIFVDESDNLWLGTRKGLNYFEFSKNKWQWFTTADGLPDDIVNCIEPDGMGNLWLSTNIGISKVSLSKRNGSYQMSPRNFSTEDGLLNKQFNRWSSCRTSDGWLLFGGIDGLDYFDPTSIEPVSGFSNVIFTEFSLFNNPVSIHDEDSLLDEHINECESLDLSYDDRVFSIEWAGLSFTQTHKINYCYYLEGFDEDWVYGGKQRRATYTNLSPGEYFFHVRVSNTSGEWSDQHATIRIFIKPPFYLTPAFFILSIVLILGSILAFYKRRTHLYRVRARELEHLVSQKTEELTVANDDMMRSKQQYKNLVEDINDVVFSTDERGKLNYISPAIYSILGYQWKEMLHDPLSRFVYEEDKHTDVFKTREKEMTEKGVGTMEIRLLSKSDEMVWVRISEKAILENNTYVGSRGVITDLSERKMLESQLVQAQKLESIGQLAAGVAHEINTPSQYLSDNLGFLKEGFESILEYQEYVCDLLDKINKKEDYSALVDTMVQAYESLDLDFMKDEIPEAIEQSLVGIHKISSIVKAMKGFSHPGSDEKVYVDVNDLIQNTIIVSSNVWKYVAKIESDCDPDLPQMNCFPDLFNQVLLNLIVNASHAIEERYSESTEIDGIIHISTAFAEDKIRISVKDNGAGIPEHAREKIFNPFFTTKAIGKGTGQGLSICYDIVVNKHGGSIGFESELDVGTEFYIELKT